MSTGGYIVPEAWRDALLKECARMRRKTLPLDEWILEEVFFWLGRVWKTWRRIIQGRMAFVPYYKDIPWWEKPPEHVNCRCVNLMEEDIIFVDVGDAITEKELKVFRQSTYEALIRFLKKKLRSE